MKKLATILLTIFMVLSIGLLGACNNETVDSPNLDDTLIEEEITPPTESKETITVEEAIILAKNDSTILNKIASRFDLVFYANPSWGVCRGEMLSGSGIPYFGHETPFYELLLRGNISGYTDSYKSDFSYGNTFIIVVYVSIYGEVSSRSLFPS